MHTNITSWNYIATLTDIYTYLFYDDIFVKKNISISPALYKMAHEIIVNTRDCLVLNCRDNFGILKVLVKKNKVIISDDTKGISNNLNKEGIHIPEMIFGNLLTSSNYDTKKKIAVGKNGYGARQTKIYWKEFIISTIYNKKILSRIYQ